MPSRSAERTQLRQHPAERSFSLFSNRSVVGFFIADVTALAEIQYFGAQASAMWRLKAAATARQVAAAASGAAALLRPTGTNGQLGAAHRCLSAPLDWREPAGHCPFLALFVHAHTQVREVAHRTAIKRFVARMPGAASLCGEAAQRCYFRKSLSPLCAPSPTSESSRRRLFVGLTPPLTAAYPAQPHSSTARARAPSPVDQIAAPLPQWHWQSKSRATPAMLA